MQNKTALITGASRGVGKEIASHLAKQGYLVVLVAKNKQLLTQACANIIKAGGQATIHTIDVSDSSQVTSCVDQIIRDYGHIDLLINNAAILKRGTTEIPDNDVIELLETNLNGAIFMAKHVATVMKEQRNGYIINISSLGGKVAASFSGVYAASKFGLSGYSEALSKEMSKYGVKVTCICPSMIATEMATGRKFPLEQMIKVDDILKTIDYLLNLSQNAVPIEILLSCLPLIKKTTELIQEMYLN